MVVAHNLMAANASRMLNITTSSQSKSTEKLSSGYRINRAADDAAGLSISEKMRKQIRGLNRATENAQDGISMVQIADGALEEVHAMLQRANELTVQAANGTNSENDRSDIQDEISEIQKEINRIGDTTSFNGLNLFRGPVKHDDNMSQTSPYINRTSANVVPWSNDLITDGKSPNVIEAYKITGDINSGKFDVIDMLKVNSETKGLTNNSSLLARKIATELFPNAIKQITDAVPALKEFANFEIDLYLEEIDGPGNTSAYAGCRFKFKGGSIEDKEFYFKVDTADFSDAEATSNTPWAGYLESTIAHEMTHSLMQNGFIAEMGGYSDRTSNPNDEDFPKWFKEGAAQLSGGGMNVAQGWNDWLANLVSGLSSENDTSKDAQIKSELIADGRTVEDNVYGNGYLAVAYMAQKASGETDITSASLAKGFNNIITEIKNGTPLSQAVSNLTGETLSDVLRKFNSADSSAVEFSRRLAYNSIGGSGSIIASSLNVGGTDLLGNTVKPSDISVSLGMLYETIDYNTNETIILSAANQICFQVGADADMTNKIAVSLYEMNSNTIGIGRLDVGTEKSATNGITMCANAIQYVSTIRSYYGAIQNRLEHTVMNLENVTENTEAAESRIRDTDMAAEMVLYSKNNILAEAGQAMLAQANSMTEGVLSLLQ